MKVKEAIPMSCRICKRPTGYIITDTGIATALAEFLNKVTSIACEKCFEESKMDDMK